jgi:hypothetical protein
MWVVVPVMATRSPAAWSGMGSIVAVEKTEKEPVRRMPENIMTSIAADTIPAYVRYFFFIRPRCNVFCALRKEFLSFTLTLHQTFRNIPDPSTVFQHMHKDTEIVPVLPGFRKNEREDS